MTRWIGNYHPMDCSLLVLMLDFIMISINEARLDSLIVRQCSVFICTEQLSGLKQCGGEYSRLNRMKIPKRGGKEDSESFILIVTSKFSFDGSDVRTDKHPKGFDLQHEYRYGVVAIFTTAAWNHSSAERVLHLCVSRARQAWAVHRSDRKRILRLQTLRRVFLTFLASFPSG